MAYRMSAERVCKVCKKPQGEVYIKVRNTICNECLECAYVVGRALFGDRVKLSDYVDAEPPLDLEEGLLDEGLKLLEEFKRHGT